VKGSAKRGGCWFDIFLCILYFFDILIYFNILNIFFFSSPGTRSHTDLQGRRDISWPHHEHLRTPFNRPSPPLGTTPASPRAAQGAPRPLRFSSVVGTGSTGATSHPDTRIKTWKMVVSSSLLLTWGRGVAPPGDIAPELRGLV